MKNYKDVTRKYYVYRILDMVGTPFYIGKGCGNRYKQHFKSLNLSKQCGKNVKIKEIYNITGEWPISEIISDNMTAAEAFNLEKQLIKEYGRVDKGTGILLNVTDGGGKEKGWIMSQIQKDKISMRHKGKKRNITWGKQLSEALKGKPKSEEHKKNISISQKEKAAKGHHNFQDSDKAREKAYNRIKSGNHHFLKSEFNKRPILIFSDNISVQFSSKQEAIKNKRFGPNFIDKLKKMGAVSITKDVDIFKVGDVVRLVHVISK